LIQSSTLCSNESRSGTAVAFLWVAADLAAAQLTIELVSHTTEERCIMTNQRNQGSGNRGFGSMDKEKQREISAKGGHASHGGQDSSNSSSQSKTRGGSSSQQANSQQSKAGRESHKNS